MDDSSPCNLPLGLHSRGSAIGTSSVASSANTSPSHGVVSHHNSEVVSSLSTGNNCASTVSKPVSMANVSELSKSNQIALLGSGNTENVFSQISFSQFSDINFSQFDSDGVSVSTNTEGLKSSQKLSYSKDEMCQAMKCFNSNDFSTHLFLRSSQAPPYKWEHTARKFLYIDVINAVLVELASKGLKLIASTAYDLIICKYKSVTGAKDHPSFYIYDKDQSRYLLMGEDKVKEYIESMFVKIDRVLGIINQYSSSSLGKNKNIQMTGKQVRLSVYVCFV